MVIIVFILILALLILVHEFGHFIVAKKAGIKVEEFGLGFPPRLWGIQKGETFYSINAIPFGGFVKIFGESPDQDSLAGPEQKRSLVNKSRSVQAAVLGAGVFFNLLLAWGLLSLGLWIGLPTARDVAPTGYTIQNPQLIITDVVKDSPAAQAGLKGGYVITSVADRGGVKLTGPEITAFQNFVSNHRDEPLTLEVINLSAGGKTPITMTLTPKAAPGSDKALLGVSLDTVGILKLPWWRAITYGAQLTISLIWLTVTAFWHLLTALLGGQTAALGAVTGPIGLVGIVGSTLSLGFSYLLNLIALISINLAVINVLPLPALDGGRLFFLVIEAIRRKAIKPEILNAINSWGFIVLIILMLVITYRDVAHLVTG